MTLTDTINNSHQLSVPSNFSLEDRTVSQNRNQSLYVPALYLPEEARITISKKAFSAVLSYRLEEEANEEIYGNNVLISKGKNTGRILKLKADLTKANLVNLTNRMQDIRRAIVEIKEHSDSIIQKKNYSLIASMLDKIISSVIREKTEIEKKVFNT